MMLQPTAKEAAAAASDENNQKFIRYITIVKCNLDEILMKKDASDPNPKFFKQYRESGKTQSQKNQNKK